MHPRLAADVGVAIGAGTDVAVAGDVVLVRSDPRDIPQIIALSRVTYRKMVQNLWWAAGAHRGYSTAAGVLAPWGTFSIPQSVLSSCRPAPSSLRSTPNCCVESPYEDEKRLMRVPLSLVHVVREPDATASTPGNLHRCSCCSRWAAMNNRWHRLHRLDPRFIVISARSPIALGPNAFAWFHVQFTAWSRHQR
jgi:hypothetical protein